MDKPEEKKINKIKFSGRVVSDRMDKTLVAVVETVRVHSRYGKRYKVSRRFKVHDPENKYKVGDQVSFKEIRPLSKDKKWVVEK